MDSQGSLKHFAFAFLIALVGYVAFFSCDKHLREKKGPWQVAFQIDSLGVPAVIVNQPSLNISNFKIIFTEEKLSETNRQTTVLFDSPLKQSPFGKVIFHDLMYLPGTVTFQLFGHEIELLPRVLILDHQEHPWKSDTTIELRRTEKSLGCNSSASPARADEKPCNHAHCTRLKASQEKWSNRKIFPQPTTGWGDDSA